MRYGYERVLVFRERDTVCWMMEQMVVADLWPRRIASRQRLQVMQNTYDGSSSLVRMQPTTMVGDEALKFKRSHASQPVLTPAAVACAET